MAMALRSKVHEVLGVYNLSGIKEVMTQDNKDIMSELAAELSGSFRAAGHDEPEQKIIDGLCGLFYQSDALGVDNAKDLIAFCDLFSAVYASEKIDSEKVFRNAVAFVKGQQPKSKAITQKLTELDSATTKLWDMCSNMEAEGKCYMGEIAALSKADLFESYFPKDTDDSVKSCAFRVADILLDREGLWFEFYSKPQPKLNPQKP